jgi:hypothetical protein
VVADHNGKSRAGNPVLLDVRTNERLPRVMERRKRRLKTGGKPKIATKQLQNRPPQGKPGPFTAVTRVRIPLGSPFDSAKMASLMTTLSRSHSNKKKEMFEAESNGPERAQASRGACMISLLSNVLSVHPPHLVESTLHRRDGESASANQHT